jgi:hypothetical protein
LQAQGDTNLDKFMAANPTPFPVDMKTGMLYNTIWMVGANQRDFIHNVGATLGVGGGKFSVPQDTLPGLTRNDANEQLQRIIVPWFWLGFTFDPSTMNVEPDYVAEGDEYFTQETFLDNGSSPIHGAFIVSKRSLEMMKYTTLPRSPNVFPFFHPDLGRYLPRKLLAGRGSGVAGDHQQFRAAIEEKSGDLLDVLPKLIGASSAIREARVVPEIEVVVLRQRDEAFMKHRASPPGIEDGDRQL